jgi:hypothetical protein
LEVRAVAGLLATISLLAAAAFEPGPRALESATLSVTGSSVPEGDSGVTMVRFVVHLSAPQPGEVRVHYSTEDRTANAGSDYLPVSGDLSIPAGAVEAIGYVPVLGDTILEMNETFLVRLSQAVGAAIAESTGVDTILNDERTRFEPIALGLLPYQHGALPAAWGVPDPNGDARIPLFKYSRFSEGRGFTEIPGFRKQLGNDSFHGAAWCDYDRDGILDLVVMPYSVADSIPSRIHLFHGRPDGSFEDVAPKLGMDIAGHGETPVWADFDGDGWPDLFAPFYCTHPPYRCYLWHNEHNGTFREMAVEAGVDMTGQPDGLRPEGAQAVDWNGDGYLDLYCASHLFLNDGSMHFTDVRQAVGLPAIEDEGAQFVDYDNDGDFDLYLRTNGRPHLFRNDGGKFVDVSGQVGLPSTPIRCCDRFVDVDNDGDLDLLIPRFDGPLMLLLNRGNGTFEVDSTFLALHETGSLHAWADVDGDGDLDAVIWNGTWRMLINRLDRVAGEDHSYLRVRALDREGHQTAHGSTVRLFGPGGTVQTRAVDGGSGFNTQDEYTVQFAAPGPGPYRLEIDYPSAPGNRVIVDQRVNPALGKIDPDALQGRSIDIWEDGRMSTHPVVVDAPAVTRSWLDAPRPVPALKSVELPFTLPSAGRVELAVHDVAGRLVQRLSLGPRPAGPNVVSWDLLDRAGRPVTPGIYFASLKVDGASVGSRHVVVE